MSCFKLFIIWFVVLSVSLQTLDAQIEVSEIIQESSIASSDNNKLYFVDFWATWCGPCVYAKKMLTVLQKQYPSDFYVISISDENAHRVKTYLNKKPSELAIAVDEEALTFSRYNIKSRPSGILFNAKGEMLWRGHPADLKPGLIQRFLNQNRRYSNLNEFITIVKQDKEVYNEYLPSKPLEVKLAAANVEALEVTDFSTYVKLHGSLRDILSHLSKIYKGQIDIDDDLNTTYEVSIKKPIDNTSDLGYKVVEQLGYTIAINDSMGGAIALTIHSPKFWDTNQIDWGKNASRYLISDSDILADNVSLKDVTYQLSNVLDMPVVITNEDASSLEPHDWQIHYKFFEFMKNNFKDYGIEAVKTKAKFPMYSIIKKAP